MTKSKETKDALALLEEMVNSGAEIKVTIGGDKKKKIIINPKEKTVNKPTESQVEETDKGDLFARAYQELISRIKEKLSQNEPFYFETTRGKKHEAIALLPGDIIRIKRTDAPKVAEYNIDKEVLELTFNHFRLRETITIIRYDTYVRKFLNKGANHGPTYIAIIRALQRISRGL